jgi:vesicle coat complex subunit
MFIKEIFKKFKDFVFVNEDEDLYKKLEHLIMKVMLTAKNFSELIGLDNFLTLLNYFK